MLTANFYIESSAAAQPTATCMQTIVEKGALVKYNDLHATHSARMTTTCRLMHHLRFSSQFSITNSSDGIDVLEGTNFAILSKHGYIHIELQNERAFNITQL